VETVKTRPGFIRIWLVEFAQNFPLVSAFIFGYVQFETGNPALVLVVVLVGVTAGALIIRYTEPRIVPGPVEQFAETATNIIFFSLAILGFILYFSWKSGSWTIDLALSAAAGLLVSLLQARAARERVSIRHLAAMTLSFGAAVLLIRFWALGASPLVAAPALTAIATTIIVLVEYLED
jgi:hypothetical protein